MATNEDDTRVILVGRTGVWKSTLGNSLLKGDVFSLVKKSNERPRECATGSCPMNNGKQLVIVDTPSLTNDVQSHTDTLNEIRKGIECLSPGPHCFILVSSLKENARHWEFFDMLKKTFGSGITKYMIIVFTDGKSTTLDKILKSIPFDIAQAFNERIAKIDCSVSLDKQTTEINKIMLIIQNNVVDKNRDVYRLSQSHGASAVECYTGASSTQEEMRVVLVGKIGVGKSRLCNYLIPTDRCSHVATSRHISSKHKGMIQDTPFVIVDTPGLSSTDQVNNESYLAIRDGIEQIPPGPHCFILVVSAVTGFTQEDIFVLYHLKEYFGNHITDNMVIVFTDLDVLKSKRTTLDRYLLSIPSDINHALAVFTNKIVGIDYTLPESVQREEIKRLIQMCSTVSQHSIYRLLPESTRGQSTTHGHGYGDRTQPPVEHDRDHLRVVMVGRTGIGKSELGNSLLQKKSFKTSARSNAGTKDCQRETCTTSTGNKLVIVDTPGLFSISRSDDDTCREISRCMELLHPGPHAFILVLSVNSRFSQDDMDTIKYLLAVFGEQLYRYMVIVFTGMDYLERDGERLEDYLHDIPSDMNRFLLKCDNRYTGINNVSTRKTNGVHAIYNLIQRVVDSNHGQCFHYGLLSREHMTSDVRLATADRKTRKAVDSSRHYGADLHDFFMSSMPQGRTDNRCVLL